jgi:hypothetical protein
MDTSENDAALHASCEANLRAKMVEAESSVSSLTSAITYEPASVEKEPVQHSRSKGFTLYRKAGTNDDSISNNNSSSNVVTSRFLVVAVVQIVLNLSGG